MDIFNKTPTISEDTLQYTLYPPSELTDKTSVTTFAALVETYVESLLPDFLWHRDAFELKVASNPDGNGWLLEGTMRVGDCVDDEWCVVWLLREVSAKWAVVIGVFDSDGEFLLIEAAEALPVWVKPTNAGNRVWIYNSHIHLIPISHVSPPSRKRNRRPLPGAKKSGDEGGNIEPDEEDVDFICTEDALKLVRQENMDTRAPLEVERIIWQKISTYPAAAREHSHVTKAFLPEDIARALSSNPSLVQKAIETFYTRDAIQLRAAHRMARFPPQPCVLRKVKMTRTAYAQLLGQNFFPPKIFGQWQEKEGTKEWRWRAIGMKIASGFEMLYQESKNRADAPTNSADAIKSSTEAQKEALGRNPDYVKYIQKLVTANYFQGEIEGSMLWNTLEDKAATTFVAVRREDDATRQSFAVLVTAAVSQTVNIPMASTYGDEDSDNWLNVDTEDFDNMLEKTMATSKGRIDNPLDAMDVDDESPGDHLANGQASKLQHLATKVEAFVEGDGDLEGARFEDEELSDEEFSDERMTSDSENEDDEQLGKVARQAAMDKLVPALEPSEYGKMPASFHSNSQKIAPTTVETDVVEEIKSAANSTSTLEVRTKPIRQPILERDRYDGVDSDDETDEEDADEDSESEEDRPQVVGEVEVDMEEEGEEFLEFSRQALGISNQQWDEIVRDRKSRGAFVPSSSVTGNGLPALNSTTAAETQAATPQPKTKVHSPGSVRNTNTNPNPNLDSFEAVMQAMDAELSLSRRAKPSNKPGKPPAPKGKAKATEPADEETVEAAMDAELKSILDRGDDGDDEGDNESSVDYNLIKNFLESFKSQAGLSGPVSNLAGRLQSGWQLPRDG